jgi:hypothetical protein
MIPRIYKFLTVLFAPFFLLACAGTGTAPSAGGSPLTLVKAASANPPRSVLYVGNSFMYYNNSLHGMVSQMARGSENA